MKASEVSILFVSDCDSAEEEHWQKRWGKKLSTAQEIYPNPDAAMNLKDWTQKIAQAIQTADKPVVLVAHAFGVMASLNAALAHEDKVKAAFLVAPSLLSETKKIDQAQNANDPLSEKCIKEDIVANLGYPTKRLPFPSLVIASHNNPQADFDKTEKLAEMWGALFMDAGESGQIDSSTGHGPWPEGLLVFSQFLAKL